MCSGVKSVGSGRNVRFVAVLVCVILVASFLIPTGLWAEPVGREQAETAVRGWLKRNPRPMEMQLGASVRKIDAFEGEDGAAIYYVIYLDLSGFVIVPADDRIEPIVAFAAKGIYDPSPENPLGALVSQDLPARVAAVQNLEKSADADTTSKNKTALTEATSKAQAKWALLQSYDSTPAPKVLDSISDVRVEPLIQSTWGQGYLVYYVSGEGWVRIPLYNYYLPGYGIGCPATAVAQLMRYHEHPKVGVGTPSFEVSFDGVEEMRSLRGGDGIGGPYRWSEMVLRPDETIADTEREAIGALCYDASISLETVFRSSGSGATTWQIPDVLKDTFKYDNAILGGDGYETDNGPGLIGMINPNLDAGCPVVLSIVGRSPSYRGHALVCDGYGYDMSTLYHHMNMGWMGGGDAWYALPIIDTTSFTYDTIDDCMYNIFPSGEGEIISGRVLGPG